MNGIESSNFETLELMYDSMRNFNIDIAGLSETNLHFNNPQVKNQYNKSYKNSGPEKSNYIRGSPYIDKLGGTAMIVTNALSHKVTKLEQDPEGLGRWSVTTIEEKKNQNKVSIINAYRPGKLTKDKRITKQQWDLLKEK